MPSLAINCSGACQPLLPPATNTQQDQPSTASRQPPTVNRQPSTANRQPAAASLMLQQSMQQR
jgi:hypothetical protein